MNMQKIEIVGAGCPTCDEVSSLVKSIACPLCEVTVLDMNKNDVVSGPSGTAFSRVPWVVVDRNLADCCASVGFQVATLEAAGVGVPFP